MLDAGLAATQRRKLTRTFASSLVVAAILIPASSSSAATTLGQTSTPYSGAGCESPSTYIQVSTGVAPSYTVPAGGGVITAWSMVAGSTSAKVRLGIFRQTGMPDEYTTIGASAAQDLTEGVLNTFPTKISVQAGDVLGLLILTGNPNCFIIDTASPQDRLQRELGSLFDVGSVHAYKDLSKPAHRLDVSARLEPDANGDGIGDEPPQTKITKRAPKKTSKSKVTFKFSADDPFAKFECKLDKKPYKSCKPPKTFKGLKRGPHTFRVRAVDGDGHRDPSPAKQTFKVV